MHLSLRRKEKGMSEQRKFTKSDPSGARKLPVDPLWGKMNRPGNYQYSYPSEAVEGSRVERPKKTPMGNSHLTDATDYIQRRR